MAKNKLPPDGTRVTAMTYPSDEYDRPARRRKGELHSRWIEVFGYAQCWIDGVQVDPATVRAATETRESTQTDGLVEAVKDWLGEVYALTNEKGELPDDGAIRQALVPHLAEACIPNRDGKGHHDDRTGHPCSADGGRQDGGMADRVGKILASMPRKLAGAALAALHKARDFAAKRFGTLEKKYGRAGAIAVMAAVVALTPVPVPGTSFAPILIAEGVRHVLKMMRASDS